MRCPKCKQTNLLPTKLEDGLPVMGCQDCGGVLVALLYYRDWAERNSPLSEYDPQALTKAEDSDAKTALNCAKCGRIMVKYLISGQHDNRINLCIHCDDAWLDNGEWELLKSLELAKQMPAVFTDQWQTKVRQEQSWQARITRLVNAVGEEDAAKAEDILQWLSEHPKRSVIQQFLATEHRH